MNLLRHPAWGRAQETYGEDPHHVGEMAAAFTAGPAAPRDGVHEALRAQLDGERSVHRRRHRRRAGAARGVPAALPAGRRRGRGVGDERLQLGQRRVVRPERSTCSPTSCATNGAGTGSSPPTSSSGCATPATSVVAGLDIEMPFRQQRAMALCATRSSDGELDRGRRRRERSSGSWRRCCGSRRCSSAATARRWSAATSTARWPERRRPHRRCCCATKARCCRSTPSSIGRVAVLGRLAAVRNLGDGGSSDVRSTEVVTPLDGLRARFGADRVVHADDDASIAADADVVVVVVGYTKADEGECIDSRRHRRAGRRRSSRRSTIRRSATTRPASARRPDRSTAASCAGGRRATTIAMAPGGDRASLRLVGCRRSAHRRGCGA